MYCYYLWYLSILNWCHSDSSQLWKSCCYQSYPMKLGYLTPTLPFSTTTSKQLHVFLWNMAYLLANQCCFINTLKCTYIKWVHFQDIVSTCTHFLLYFLKQFFPIYVSLMTWYNFVRVKTFLMSICTKFKAVDKKNEQQPLNLNSNLRWHNTRGHWR